MKNKTLVRSISILTFSFFAIAASSFAQEKRVEINPFFGYTFSDGVTVDPFIVGGQVYDSINPKSGMAFGVQFGFFVSENMEVGFLYSRQDSMLEAKNGTSREFTDMSVDNYHAIFTYNFGDEETVARPFIFGGLGATSFVPSDIEGTSIDGETRFSSTWGGRREGLPESNGRIHRDGPLDPDLYQERPGGGLVLAVLGLRMLRLEQRPVLEPVRIVRGTDPEILRHDEEPAAPSSAPPWARVQEVRQQQRGKSTRPPSRPRCSSRSPQVCRFRSG